MTVRVVRRIESLANYARAAGSISRTEESD